MKCENLLFDKDGTNIKIADFGLAKETKWGELLYGYAGTPYYMAPEIHTGWYEGTKVDIFATGVILFVMVMGRMPFYEAKMDD